ncbi:MAG: class I SAM-dependent methyltransferase [Syntrophobacterales bacterium]|jgi:SAM-dependent methyltransferase
MIETTRITVKCARGDSVKSAQSTLKPAQLLVEHSGLFLEGTLPGPVLDLACGEAHNSIFLALKGVEVIGCDLSSEALKRAGELAMECGAEITVWRVDLESEGVNPLPEHAYGAILVFRYLHRPLIPCIKKALRNGGLLLYETFTVEQRRFGKPRNPDYLLELGELRQMFADWEVIHYFEGVRENPTRAVAQMVCRKPEGIEQRA